MEGWIYIQVILPLKLPWEPFYKTAEKNIMPGMRVCVPFAGKHYTAVVSSVDVIPEVDTGKVLEISGIERHLDIIGDKEILLWRFMADYYLCTIGEVYRLAYPSFKTAGEKVYARMSERKAKATAKELESYRQRLSRLHVRLSAKEAGLEKKHGDRVRHELENAILKIKKEIMEVKDRIEGIMDGTCTPLHSGKECRITSGIQETCTSRSVMDALAQSRNVLLEAGSCRVPAIITAAAATVAKGRDVLLLVPEIERSRDLLSELSEYFGNSLLVFHSEESAAARRETASALRHDDGPHFVLGTKSALFLPFRKLGLVVVDEEHDILYKQDSSPRFIARDTAVMLGGIHGANVLLCSLTPSLESLYNCISGRYVHVMSDERGGDVEIVDIPRERKKGGMLGQWSRILVKRIRECMEKDGRVLVIRPWGPFDDLEDEMENILPDAVESGSISFLTIHQARRSDLNGFGLLAIVGADIMLDRQDFRADEKAMQILEHFRSAFSGRMLVQTSQASHPVFCLDREYRKQLLAERKAFNYPPYSRIVDIVFTDHNIQRMKKLSASLRECLKAFAPVGPFTPVKGKNPENGKAIIRIMLPKDKALKSNKKEIVGIVGDFERDFKYFDHIAMDVDPV